MRCYESNHNWRNVLSITKNWQNLPLHKVSKKAISYGIVQTGEHIENGIPCIRVVDLNASNLTTQAMITTSQEINQSYKRTILEKGEIIIALRGNIGLVRLVDENLVGCNLTRGVARIAPDENLVTPDFLLWAMRSPLFRDDLLRRVNGSALQEIPILGLRKTMISVPPIDEQKKIAEILGTWDEAIGTIGNLLAEKQSLKRLIENPTIW
jgi:type I restriction enzyme, S subunit